MKKEKRKKKFIIALAILLLALIVCSLVYAKYLSSVSGQGEISVAKWAFTVNNETSNLGTVDLGEEHYDPKTIDGGVIAPGTRGIFYLTVDATGNQTGLDYSIKFNDVKNKPANMYFIIDGTVCRSIEQAENALKGHFDANQENKTSVRKIEWVWDYETTWNEKSLEKNDEIDTADGITAKDFSFTLKATGVQSEPAI